MRCTGVCPSGIDLQDLWGKAREAILRRGEPELSVLSPLSFYRAMSKEGGSRESMIKAVKALSSQWASASENGPIITGENSSNGLWQDFIISDDASSYSLCFRCSTCSNACPVVAVYNRPSEALDLLPHQIMHATSLGFGQLVFNARMLWYCVGCYQCQEHCPQGVRVADILHELKGLAWAREETWEG
jgi:heterodisulfide reductase subunit C